MHVVDLDTYHQGPFPNTMGRMFGSTRFMAPEELTFGARVDERTTVFAMGRLVQQSLPSDHDALAGVAARACEPNPADRFQTVAELYRSCAFAPCMTG
jgi:serine/threonine-protein kinase